MNSVPWFTFAVILPSHVCTLWVAACFCLKAFPLSDRLNSAPDFTYFGSNTVSQASGAGSH